MNAQENDESLLIDFCLHQLDQKEDLEVRERLDRDPQFQKLHKDISNSFDALKLLPPREAAEDLAQRTMARIRQIQNTEALIAREEIGRGRIRPTFSMREAMVIAASLLIVATILIPSVRQSRRMAQITQCGSNMGQIGSALLSYANSNNDRLPSAGQGTRWLPGNDHATSNSSALFKLVSNRYAPQLLFVCPANSTGKPFEVSPGIVDFPSATNIHYSYQHTVGPRDLRYTDPALAAVKGKMVILADSTPFFGNGQLQADQAASAASENHNRTGQNVLYLDMHVAWAKDPSAGVNGNNIFLAEGIYNYRGDETPVDATDTFLLPTYTVQKK